jgi:TetR/AcrR family transcriptional regulator, cholesterol catabolism regulator
MSSGAPNSGADTRPGDDPALTRRLLLDSALELFGEKGFHASSVQEIVEAAGLTKGAFYHHFANKEDVLMLTQDELVAVQATIVEEILESHSSAVAQLRALVRMMVLNASRYQSRVAVVYRGRRFLAGERAADVDDRWDVVQPASSTRASIPGSPLPASSGWRCG